MDIKEAIKEYQCPSCVYGSNLNCGSYKKSSVGSGCGSHMGCDSYVAGTMLSGVGKIFPGVEKGFDRLGACPDYTQLVIFETQEQQEDQFSYDWKNIPVWKYKNKHSHILIRGLFPRINKPFLHIILIGDIQAITCLEITDEMLNGID